MADAEVGAVFVVVSIVVDRGVVSILVVVREIISSVVVRGDIDVAGMAGHITSAPARESSLRDSLYFLLIPPLDLFHCIDTGLRYRLRCIIFFGEGTTT